MNAWRQRAGRAIEYLATVLVCSAAVTTVGFVFGTMIDPISRREKMPIEKQYAQELSKTDQILEERDPCEPLSEARKTSVYAVGTLQNEHSVWFIKYMCPHSAKTGTVVWSPSEPK